MNKSAIDPMPEYFDRYISQVPDDLELVPAIQKSILDIYQLDKEKISSLGDDVYAPGKWTIKQILLHIADTERVFIYRALRFARKDSTPVQSFDENLFAENSAAGERTLESLLDELVALRQSTLAFYKNLSDEQLLATGHTYKSEMSVLAMGFTIVGHQAHHFRIIEDRYFPLLNAQ
ncbi:DinB family protein [Niabella drilacis]|uniref:DinB superfamily protein n=1 Tax=Niabella drilacis (strain DSM 25811 / CCM 8410 / CCUG 62505 / LMG 26954 / E90) TaxID=1285928 RepID=A0A1G6KRK2_NIADE|nr:DinB family protein [Niabella drilacis]SDC33145.1 DinB superfamily protein [Niabella drilacis]